jgi:hypothetical protein
MAKESVGNDMGKRGTNQFMRQGHTASNAYGNSPSTDAKGAAGASPKDLKP